MTALKPPRTINHRDEKKKKKQIRMEQATCRDGYIEIMRTGRSQWQRDRNHPSARPRVASGPPHNRGGLRAPNRMFGNRSHAGYF